ncbi:MAG: transcriptional regulator GutM [Selenomonadaceae bacterium]|nr:transcriptional regulator GutM [Selenomonadaceae bacterium]MBR1858929.1 transcriptional regulator GutM [Selenomonadaceae bacterium]
MLLYVVALAVIVWIMQLLLGLWQFKRFSNHIKNLRTIGRVAIGRAKGRFLAGVIVLLVIDNYCRIIKGEIMEGRTVFADFKEFNILNGLTLFELSDELCKSLNLDFQKSVAVMSAKQDYENYQIMQQNEG